MALSTSGKLYKIDEKSGFTPLPIKLMAKVPFISLG
jgi:hypothetical protein